MKLTVDAERAFSKMGCKAGAQSLERNHLSGKMREAALENRLFQSVRDDDA